jgi:hypothetical protein
LTTHSDGIEKCLILVAQTSLKMLKGRKMLKKFLLVSSAFASMAVVAPAQAAVIIVDARGNSSTGGTGANTGLALTAGQTFTVTSSTTDLWNAGPLPRWSNANGLIGDLFATGSDESGAAAGTLIGEAFPLWNQFGITAPYGSLVGEIGGVYQLLGNPTALTLTPGQACDLEGADALLPSITASTIIADKAYDADERMIVPALAAGMAIRPDPARWQHRCLPKVDPVTQPGSSAPCVET